MKKWTYFVSILSLLGFILLVFIYEHPSIVQMDDQLNRLLFGNRFISFFHLFGDTKFIIAISVILIVLIWFRQRNYRGMLLVVLTVGVGNWLNQQVKSLIERPRPELGEHLTSFSFPSGHAMVGLLYLFTIAYIITELIKRREISIFIWGVSVLLVILIGLSRVAYSHHYATDVFAGWCLGFTWFVICIYWYEGKREK